MDALNRLQSMFEHFRLSWILELIIIFAVFFIVYKILFKNNAQKLIWIHVVFTLLTGAFFFISNVKNAALYMFLCQGFFIVATISLFSMEVKRSVWTRHGDHKQESMESKTSAEVCVEEIIRAVQDMSKNNIGALIILSNNNVPEDYINSGTNLDATISSKLIESIFFPKTELHDGALVINGTKIQSAGCFVNLTENINLPRDLGTRHRAAIGLTEEADVTVIIVSEETGIISIAKGGKIIRYVDTSILRDTLKQYYWQDMIE